MILEKYSQSGIKAENLFLANRTFEKIENLTTATICKTKKTLESFTEKSE